MAGAVDWLFASCSSSFSYSVSCHTYSNAAFAAGPLLFTPGYSRTYRSPSVSAVGRDNPASEWDRASARQMRFSRKALTSIGFPYRITWPNPDDWNLARCDRSGRPILASITAAQCAMSTVQFRSEGYDKLGGYTIMIRQLARFVDGIGSQGKIRLSGDR